jgi:hypothetical protein
VNRRKVTASVIGEFLIVFVPDGPEKKDKNENLRYELGVVDKKLCAKMT